MKKKVVKSGQLKKRRTPLRVVRETREKVGEHFSERFVGRLQNVREVRLWVAEWALLVLVVFLLAIVQIIWYGESYEREAFVRGGDYSEATLGKVNSMNPLYATTSSEKTLARLLFANLVSPDVSGHIKGELAKSVTMDDTGKIWTVVLRDGIRWSDGEAITADDVIYTVGLISNTDAKTTISADFSKAKIEKIDEKTVKFTLPSVYVDFADTLEFPLVPEHVLKDVKPALVYENDFSTNPVVSGPFVLNAVQVAGSPNVKSLQTIYLNKNEEYFGVKPTLNSFTLKTFETKGDIESALRNLDVTATAELDEGIEGLPSAIGYRASRINGGVFAFMNTGDGVLKEVKIRQAIRQMVNIDEILGENLSSLRIDYPFLPEQGENLTNPELPVVDLAAAKTLLTNAGYSERADGKFVDGNNQVLSLKLAVPNRGNMRRVAEAFTNKLREFGIDAILNVYDEEQGAADFFSTIVKPRDYDILFYEIDLGVSADPFVYYSSTQASTSGWNFSNYSNSLVDDALLSAHITTNLNTRKAKYEYFLRAWVNDVPSIPLYQSSLRYYYADSANVYSSEVVMTDALDRFGDVHNWATKQRRVNVTP